MKSMVKFFLGPLVRKFEGRMSRLIEATVRRILLEELDRSIHPTLEFTQAEVRGCCRRTEEVMSRYERTARENTLLLDSLIRELVRMQMQLETIAPANEREAAPEPVMIG